MDKHLPVEENIRRFSLKGLSIQQRLPLLICALLLCLIITFSVTSYFGVRSAALAMGRERLHSLTDQLSSMFGRSMQGVVSATQLLATQQPVREFLNSGGLKSKEESMQALEKLQIDSATVLVELLGPDRRPLLSSASDDVRSRVNFDLLLGVSLPETDSAHIGKLSLANDSVYYPVLLKINDSGRLLGYIVRWRQMHATPVALEQFSQLLGADASISIGNADGRLWTDLTKPVAGPAIQPKDGPDFFKYQDAEGRQAIASVKPVPSTPWVILIGLSEQKVLEAASRFLGLILITGSILIIIGIFIARKMSRNITRPLNKLTAAASSIARGDQPSTVEVGRNDETGKLAFAFNIMTEQIGQARQSLEQKVLERTSQLEAVNKELEAFSYSVSHDLRAPLRAINGYARILKEDYGSNLDEQAGETMDKIISNAKMMGQLIDDLISFSKMGGQELVLRHVAMQKLAESCLAESLQHEPAGKYQVRIGTLPDCLGDPNLIKQVWMNLISNAVKYSSRQAEPRIEIGCEEGAAMNTYYIKDNGVGFDMQYAHKLFGVFQRLHSQKVFEGTGIGLAFVKRIILKHGGEIRADAAPGLGASFYFSLPVTASGRSGAETRRAGISTAIESI